MKILDEDTWITQKAAEEDGASVLAGCIRMTSPEPLLATSDVLTARLSFSKFVHLARLKLALTKEQFANKAKIPLKELEDDYFDKRPEEISPEEFLQLMNKFL